MPRRYYSSVAVATTLSGAIGSTTTSLTVTSASGFPAQTPWTAVLDADTALEEVVTVTNVAGTTLTVTRGVDGTSGTSHAAGATFKHGVSARDFDEPNAFVNTMTTKGDLITRSSSADVRLGVGSNGQVLTADSGETTGLKWTTPTAPHATSAASLTVTGLSTSTSDSISVLGTINWPNGRFSQTPIVVVSSNEDSLAPGSYKAIFTSGNSTSSTTIYYANANSSTTITKLSVNAIAIQMTSGSATG